MARPPVNWSLFAEKVPPNTRIRRGRMSGTLSYRLRHPHRTYRFRKHEEGVLMCLSDSPKSMVRILPFACPDTVAHSVFDLDFFLGGQWVPFHELGVTIEEGQDD
jgi:hypothetical protein